MVDSQRNVRNNDESAPTLTDIEAGSSRATLFVIKATRVLDPYAPRVDGAPPAHL